MAIVPAESTALVRSEGLAINWEERAKIAKVAASTELVPKAYRGKYEDCLIAMQYGAEIGLPPMSALQSIAVIGGKPGVYGDGFLGVVMAAPSYRAHRERYVTADGVETTWLSQADLMRDETRAVAVFWRRGIDDPFVAEFSIADAKRARLWNKEGSWQQFPARMLKWRAREFAARDAFAPELRGIAIAELLEPEGIIEAPPIVPPVRRSEKVAAAATAAPPEPTPEPTPEPPAPPAPDFGPEPTPEPEPPANQLPPLPPLPPTSKPAPPIRSIKPEVTASDSVVITDTAFIQRKGEEPYYEVRARVSAEGKAPIAYVFVTRDKALYELAASAEGTPQTFAVTWRNAKKQDGAACKILDSIEAS